MSAPPLVHDAATLRRRTRLSRTWAAIVVGWALVRTIVVWAAVGEYGLNPWIYLVLDLCAATIDAFTTPRMVLSFIDDHFKQAAKWGVISLVVFLIPDVYIFAGTRKLPSHLIIIVGGIVALTLAAAAWGVIRRIRQGRAGRMLAE